MIKIENLTVEYPDGTVAVDNLSLTVEDGETVVFAGANGAGKTSLFLAMVGVIPIKSGTINVDGLNLGKNTLNEIRKNLGLVFQNPDDQLFMPSIYEDIAFGPRNYGLNEEEVKKRVDKVMSQLGIAHLKDRSPFKLSGGEKRTAAIATILTMEPSAMLFDEPTAFLDPKARRKLINLLNSLEHSKLIATHDLTFAQEVTDRVILLKNGKIFSQGNPRELFYDEKLMDDCGIEAIK